MTTTEKFVVLDANDPHQIVLRHIDVMAGDTEHKDTVEVTFKEKDGQRTVSKIELKGAEKKGQTAKEMVKETEKPADDRLGVVKPTEQQEASKPVAKK